MKPLAIFYPLVRRILFFSLALAGVLSSLSANGQNLIPNGSFEDNTTIPCGLLGSSAMLSAAATAWSYPTIGTSDLFSTTVATACVNYSPTCPIWGAQSPRTGNEFAGFYCHINGSTYKEYLMARLDTPTIVGETYCVEMFVSRGDLCQYDVSHIGLLLVTDSVYRPITTSLNRTGTAHIYKPTPVSQDTGWEAITGTIVADSVYRYVIIGCLFDTSVYYTTITDMAATRPYGYYYADDVRVDRVVISPGSVNTTDSTICLGDMLTLWADTSNGSDVNYVWSDGSTGRSLTVASEGAYYVDITSCGFSQRDSFNVYVDSIPTANLGPDSSFCLGESYTYDATHPTAIAYNWSDGGSNPIRTFTQSGSYALEVIGECGSTIDDIEIEVLNCECVPQVPNAFTPNADGLNDLFRPVMLGCASQALSFTVHNRYGELVYSHGANSQGWDGQFKGQDCDNGVYVWYLEYLSNDQQYTFTKKGTVTLVR